MHVLTLTTYSCTCSRKCKQPTHSTQRVLAINTLMANLEFIESERRDANHDNEGGGEEWQFCLIRSGML